MCGIVGGIDLSGSVGHGLISKALARMKHRGPDAEGIYENAPAFLGHRRLSIIDLDARANQPLRVDHLVISFNGEIYNYRSVRQDLELTGIVFSTQSDTEVVIRAFQYEGLACLQRFEGMFAFAIWDEQKKSLIIARDRFGEKPLIYYHDGDYFFFASEIPALETLVGRDRLNVDPEAIRLYFQFSYIPVPYAPYRHMHQLEPGCWLEFDATLRSIRTGKYYTLKPQPQNIRKQDCIAELRQRLTDSIALRLSASDVPVATFLSGGIDSSIISALTAKHATSNVSAYSIGFPDDKDFDESSYARMVAAAYPQLRHKVIDVTENTLMNFVESTLSKLGEPFADSSIIPTAFLCSHVDEKVILGGDGADELFAGYGVYAAMRTSAKLPDFLKKAALAFPAFGNPHAIQNPKLRAVALFRCHMAANPLDEYLSWRNYAATSELKLLGIDIGDSARKAVRNLPLDSLSDLLALDIGFNLPNDMLKKVDLASMQHAVEVRLPYLDKGLVEFALSLPENLLINHGIRKYILREAFSDLLPESIMKRRKQGFLLPVRKWFKNGMLRDQLYNLANETTTLDKSALKKLLYEHEISTHDHSVLLWSCYVFLRWSSR